MSRTEQTNTKQKQKKNETELASPNNRLGETSTNEIQRHNKRTDEQIVIYESMWIHLWIVPRPIFSE